MKRNDVNYKLQDVLLTLLPLFSIVPLRPISLLFCFCSWSSVLSQHRQNSTSDSASETTSTSGLTPSFLLPRFDDVTSSRARLASVRCKAQHLVIDVIGQLGIVWAVADGGRMAPPIPVLVGSISTSLSSAAETDAGREMAPGDRRSSSDDLR